MKLIMLFIYFLICINCPKLLCIIYIYIYIYFNLKHYVNAVNMEILTMGQYDNSS